MNNLNRLKGENSETEEILPQEDFIKFYQNLNSRDKDHNSVQKQIIEEFVSLKNNFSMSEVIGDLNNEISTDEIIEAIRSIRNGKIASTDLISNEMLKKCSLNFNKTTSKTLQSYIQKWDFSQRSGMRAS